MTLPVRMTLSIRCLLALFAIILPMAGCSAGSSSVCPEPCGDAGQRWTECGDPDSDATCPDSEDDYLGELEVVVGTPTSNCLYTLATPEHADGQCCWEMECLGE